MRILVVNDILQGGGVEKLMHDLVLRLRSQGNQVAILTDKKDPEFSEIYPADVEYFYQMEKEWPKSGNRIERKINNYKKAKQEKNLKEEIMRRNFDVMLCMKESWIMWMAITYGEHIPKRIAWVHTDYNKSYYTRAWYTAEQEVEMMQRYNYVVCVSQAILDSIKQVIGDPGNLVLRYNPLDRDDILKKSEEEVDDIKRSDLPLFVSVGRLNIQKGYDILLEVCNLLNIQGYKYELWIVGGGEEWNRYETLHDLENRIYRYKLDNVHLLGHKSNPHKYVKQADWFLSSSRYEGFSYVSQEAAILGKALILTECAGVMELFGTEENGIVMENSYAGIYYGMKDVIEHPEKVSQYSNRLNHYDSTYYGEDRYKDIESLFI